jgi:hypothetical protein
VNDVVDLQRELLALARGAGLQNIYVGKRIGPQLRRVAHINDADSAEQIQQKLIGWIDQAIDGLSRENAQAARAALALEPGPTDRYLTARLHWLAEQTERTPRTANRWIQTAMAALAVELNTLQPIEPGIQAAMTLLDDILWLVGDVQRGKAARLLMTSDLVDRIRAVRNGLDAKT